MPEIQTTGKPTIRDVAHEAGVAVSTVSKYLTGRPYVSQSTAARIQAAVDRLGFQPDGLGRALATGQTKVIGVIVASLSNPFYTELVEEVDREAAKAGFSILLAATERDPSRERQVMEAMLQKGVDGLVFAHVAATDGDALRRAAAGKAIVFASRHFEASDDEYVVIDGAKGGRLAAEHLVELGHRRIGLVSGPLSVTQFRWRLAGFLGVLREHGLEAPSWLLEAPGPGRDWLNVGRQAVEELLKLPDARRPTAVHTANDLLAFGLLDRARERGLEVPGDLSVVGFDNVAFGAIAAVPLTTIDSRISEIAGRATRLLLARLDGRAAESDTQQVLEPSLVVRASTAAANNQEEGES